MPFFRGTRYPLLTAGSLGGFIDPLSLSPLAWWRFEDGSGATAVDSSGNGYDLALSNTPTWIAGHIGGGINFASASSEKGASDAAGLLASLQGLSAFTVAFWARAAGYQGTVVLSVEIHQDGKAHNIRVLRGLGLGLNEQAMDAVSRWQFRPGNRGGQPVAVQATIEVNYRLL